MDGLLHHQEDTHICEIDMAHASYMQNEPFLDYWEDSPKLCTEDLHPFALPKQQIQHCFSDPKVEVVLLLLVLVVELKFLLQHVVVIVHLN
jgi:hypothetical protein